jgi:hypothetical protein
LRALFDGNGAIYNRVISFIAKSMSSFWGDDAQVTGIAVPKFTNIYPKRGISVNLPQLCEVGLLATKAGLGFNIFKEPVPQILRA